MLLRLEDSSEMFLSYAAVKRVHLQVSNGIRWGFPTLDVFAGGASQQHVVSRYYTLFHTHRALATNAMYQHRKQEAGRNPGML